jgi:hypothetical protein
MIREMNTRRFPPPWRAEKMPGGWVVRDANDLALAYVYRRANAADAMAAKVLTGGRGAPRGSQYRTPARSAKAHGMTARKPDRPGTVD